MRFPLSDEAVKDALPPLRTPKGQGNLLCGENKNEVNAKFPIVIPVKIKTKRILAGERKIKDYWKI